MTKIDSHQHFWKYELLRHDWIDGSMSAIQRDFMPGDLKPVLNEFEIDGCVLVQVDQTGAENDFLLGLAEENDCIKGVVGWVDLMAEDIDRQLAALRHHQKLKGFRHILQGETNRALMLNESFLRGVKALGGYNFTYDILVYQDQLQYIPEFAGKLPDQKLVLDHIGKPNIKSKSIKRWSAELTKLKSFEYVYCKISGMVTEANWDNWKYVDFEPYLDVAFNTFGTDRIMYGSDWPVCNVAGGYHKMYSVANTFVSKLSDIEQAKFWGINAAQFYNLIL